MFGVGATELLLLLVVLAVAVVASRLTARGTAVNQTWLTHTEPVELERLLLVTLGEASRGRAASAGPGRLVLLERSTPTWAIILAVFTLPLGLLFLLVKTERTLTVMIESEPSGTRVDLVGSTRARTLASIDMALVTEHDAGARSAGTRL